MERAWLSERIARLSCARRHGASLFLANPQWTTRELAVVEKAYRSAAAAPAELARGWLCIPTGGTSGDVRFVRHDERTLGSAVEGFCQYFETITVNAVGLLPEYHVSGLMARLRCEATGGHYLAWPWKRLEAGDCPKVGGGSWFVSVVPTQLHRLLMVPACLDWLRGFHAVFVGGAPVWPDLLQRARSTGLQVSLTYGSTETAAMVAALQPAEFLAGAATCGRLLPHVDVRIRHLETNALQPPGQPGLLEVRGPSVCLGYFGSAESGGMVRMEDLGELGTSGHLRIIGRRDHMIISGGEKISPAEVEAVLLAAGLPDVAVVGMPDGEWGQAVVACYPEESAVNLDRLRQAAAENLAPHKRPKRYVAMAAWPRNDQGKVMRAELLRRLA